ncbi:MAG: hypothetical protein HPY79_05895, partial [Bacteroidales bacterium]|nr:hypothetical protein [Bacteroidales bacterium]
FKVLPQLSPSVGIIQRQLYLNYRNCLKNNNLPKLSETGFRVFSQFEEDGKLLYIFSLIGMTHKTFVEFGSDDGVNSNSANLYFHFGWTGLFIDANKSNIKRGERFFSKYPHPWCDKPKFICSFITRDNINDLIKKAGFEGEIGFLSIDIDGNDYWIWDALTVVNPQVVMIETNNVFGYNNIVVPYNPEYFFPGKHPIYHGASPQAMVNLAKKKGYRLVGANELGFNLIFVRNGILENEIPEVTISEILMHPSCIRDFEKFNEIKDFDFIQG